MKKTILFAIIISISALYGQTETAPTVGDGSAGTPYQIATLENLYWITANSTRWAFHYTQTADIDASATSTWDGASGWSPIGNWSTNFTGTYNGQNYLISNLFINRPSTQYVGLFGVIVGGVNSDYPNYRQIKNIKLSNCTITGLQFVGCLTGQALEATIDNCSSSGSVSITSTDWYAHIGGLIGEGRFIIKNCNSSANVSATSSDFVGGLVGQLWQSSGYTIEQAKIENCYTTGDVQGKNNSNGQSGLGGLVGRMEGGVIRNCYTRGNVTRVSGATGEYIGAFIGNYYTALTEIYNSYSIGNVYYAGTSNPTTKGFAGNAIHASSSGNFFDNQTSNQTSATGATGKTTVEMKTESIFTTAGWDFSTIWEMIPDNFPRLQNLPDAALPVELTSFSATITARGVELAWITATETRNHGFEIERACDNEMNSWSTIAFIEGHGTSNAPKSYFYTDREFSGGRCVYRLKQIDRDGNVEYLNEVEVRASAPTVFVLSQNFPNPFNPRTMIYYQTPMNSRVTLKVFDILGKEVTSLVDETKEAGSYRVQFDGTKLSSGVYYYTIKAGDFTATKKLLLTK